MQIALMQLLIGPNPGDLAVPDVGSRALRLNQTITQLASRVFKALRIALETIGYVILAVIVAPIVLPFALPFIIYEIAKSLFFPEPDYQQGWWLNPFHLFGPAQVRSYESCLMTWTYGKGLPNLTNTCFINATLQSLARIENIVPLLQPRLVAPEPIDEQTRLEYRQRNKLRRNILRIVTELKKEAPVKDVVYTCLKTIATSPIMEQVFGDFGHQHDSQEFLSLLSDQLKLQTNPASSVVMQKMAMADAHGVRLPEGDEGRPLGNIEGPRGASSNIYLSHHLVKIDDVTGQEHKLLTQPQDELSIHQILDSFFDVELYDDPLPLEDLHANFSKFVMNHDHLEQLETLNFTLPRRDNRQKLPGSITGIWDPIMLTINGEKIIFEPTSCVLHEGNVQVGHYTTIIREGASFRYISDSDSRLLNEQQAKDLVKTDGYSVSYKRLRPRPFLQAIRAGAQAQAQ